MKVEEHSPAMWMLKNNFINERGIPLAFDENHLFLYEIYKDLSPRQVLKKAAQIGASVMLNLKSFYMCKYKKYDVIYTMPSDTDVYEFVRTKTDKIFMSNPVLRKDIKIDNVGLKGIVDRFIYFKGTRSKTAPLSTTADLLIHDEIDRSDMIIIEQYASRIGASKYKGIWLASNPSISNVGVDIMWKDSDQKEWFIKCKGCGLEQQLIWEENVDEIRGIYVCKSCGKELTPRERRLGRWIPTNPGGEVSGYHISQMMAAWLTAKQLVKEKEKRGLEYFLNFVLGEPYHIGTTTDFRQMILDCYTTTPLDKKPYFLGVDIGIEKHYVLGSKEGVFETGKVKSRQQVEHIIEKYNPITVMDAGPERTWAEEFKDKYPNLHLCFFRTDRPRAEIVKWGGMSGNKEDLKDIGYVWVDRNRIIDLLISEILNGRMLFRMQREVLEAYMKHWGTMRRIEEGTALGSKRYKWESTTGEDHWVMATVYYWLAKMKGGGVVEFLPTEGEKKEVIERTPDGFRMRSLKEIMEEQNE